MKKVIVILLMGLGIVCASAKADTKEFREHLTKEFAVTKDGSGGILFIYNISGFIKVEGYDGNKVLLEMDKTISAENDQLLETGKKEFKLGFDQRTDTVMAYIADPFDSRPHRNWQYNDTRRDRDIEYNYNVDFTVKVPFGMNLHISTVNEGIVTVNNVGGTLHVSNVNGEISIKNAKATTYAHTINGDVTVTYLVNPADESSYYTINGTIRVNFQPGLSADLQFKSMNGEFFTDFMDATSLPPTVNKTLDKKSGGSVYKLNSSTSVRFGKGGKRFRFETLNGNIYIKKQS